MGRSWVAALPLLAVLAACYPSPVACTEIGAQSGVGVSVLRAAAPGLTGLAVRVCWADRCTDRRVELRDGYDSVDQGCDPNGVCSASASPNGTLVGFVDLPDLPAGPVRVSGTLSRGTASVSLSEVEVAAETIYPNGVGCPGEGNQASVTVGPDGLR